MADHLKPTNASTYANYTAEINGRVDDALKGLDPYTTTPTNVPTNSIRWNSASGLWQKWSGTAWNALASVYNIVVSKAKNIVGGNNTTLLGSIPYQSNTDTTTLLAPNTTTTRKFLRMTGTGANGAIPVWDTILASDVPTLNQSTTGNAGTATKLATARTINGVSFDGSANINIEDRLGTDIASSTTTTIGTAGLGDYINITGTTTITSFGTASSAGIRRTLIFDNALTITHNATSLICAGASNIVTVAGTVIEVIAETTANWRVVSVTHPSVSHAELGYLDGVTSNIQTQFNTLTTNLDALKDVATNTQSVSYTLALTDRGKSIDTSASVTVPLNSTVAFPIGTVITITNTSAAAITLTQTAGVTLRQAGTANTGNRTLAAYGMATLRKVATDTWFISGAGLS